MAELYISEIITKFAVEIKKVMKDKISFVRFGNLNPVKHKEHRKKLGPGYEIEKFHIAPKLKGIYAFPHGYVSLYLVDSCLSSHWMRYLLDANGKKIDICDFYDPEDWRVIRPEYKKLLKRQHVKESMLVNIEETDDCCYIGYRNKPKRFDYTGPVWHHLKDCVKPESIIEEYGCWVKTSFKDYCKALHKRDTMDRFKDYMEFSDKHGNPHTYPIRFKYDDYEVFIERI